MRRLKAIAGRVFVQNGWLKLVSLGLAAVLYVIAREETIHELDIELRLEVKGVAANRIFVSQPPAALRVLVRGHLQKLTEVLARRTPFEVDLSEAKNGETVVMAPAALEKHLGEGVEVLSITPSSFTLEFDEVKTKRVPVAVDILKSPGPYWLAVREKVVVEPRFVEVSGPGTTLRSVRQMHTEPLDLSEATQDFSGKLALEERDGVKVSPRRVSVTVPIVEKQGSKVLKAVRVRVKGCPYGFTCTVAPPFFQVKVEGRERVAAQVTPENVSQYVYVDAGKLPVEAEILQKYFPAVEPTREKLQGVTMTLTGPKYFNVTVVRSGTRGGSTSGEGKDEGAVPD